MERLLEFLERVTRSTSIHSVWDALVAESAAAGFDRLIYGFTRYGTESSLGSPDDFLILTNFDPSYTRRFIEDRLYLHAPMVRWAAESEGACSWRWVEENGERLTDEARAVTRFNQGFGITAGWSVSFPSVSRRAKGGIGFVVPAGVSQSEADRRWASSGRMLEQMATVAHLKIITLPHNSGTRPELTDRQREVLEWTGDGKTAAEIAEIMGLKPATIEKHLRLAREVLGVQTTAQAVLKASAQNQIFAAKLKP